MIDQIYDSLSEHGTTVEIVTQLYQRLLVIFVQFKAIKASYIGKFLVCLSAFEERKFQWRTLRVRGLECVLSNCKIVLQLDFFRIVIT